MNTQQSRSQSVHATLRQLRAGQVGTLAAALAVGLLVATPAVAATVTVDNEQDPNQVSSFTLDFGDPSLVTTALITQTDYTIELATDILEAYFVNYQQDVDPLILPGEFSTGAIHIEIVDGSSVGTIDLLNREFATADLYAIHFEGDLSAFGLESPVLLPGASTGTISFDADGKGYISMAWDGQSELQNPGDPSQPIVFTYTCAVNTTFAPAALPVLSLDLVPELLNLELVLGVERRLNNVLESAQRKLEQDQPEVAQKKLGHFIRMVDRLRGDQLSDEEADRLIDKADTVVELIDAQID
ncbi:MAG: hypothetical protein IID40_01020 [Planctomycetes bacterium]|nr:hypothetical protein [Planctomycetota bacterium]